MAASSQVIAGRYELTTPISRGGMGEVWRGYDTVLDRDIAVKLIRPGIVDTDEDREELIGRFKREARVTAKVEHPGVPAVYDAAFDSSVDRLFIVMQLVHGVSLADVLAERGALPTAWAASIAAQICAVLSYAHAVPIVHRDLKPGNIMIAEGGGVKVLDFGIAAVLRSGVTKLTSTGRVIGTKPYMSPEQIQNAPISPQSDLYALGCLLHEVLSRQRVFDAEDEIALMYQHLEAEPTPLRRIVPEVPAELEGLVLELLAKRPTERPQSAWAVYDRLVPFLPTAEPSADDQELPAGAVPDPTRPYRRPGAPRPRPVAGASVEPLVDPVVDQREIDSALSEVEELVDGERFTQATDLLAELLPRASAAFGAEGTSVLDLRISYAAALLLGGDYRRAAPQFEALAATFERIQGPLDEETLDYRRQAVVCRIALGETDATIPELESIIRAYKQVDGDSHDVLALRLSLARLRISAGQRQAAVEELRQLHEDAVGIPGSGDELTAEIDQMRRRLGGSEDG
ncbi:protein kinase [Kribbella qitaiheensis]|uniref:serine/threonine-protein kinase n=1 Tax=Kribbella qitaiheensis TaxID=1544730 RepID=UPI003612C3B7